MALAHHLSKLLGFDFEKIVFFHDVRKEKQLFSENKE
jgi:hypothetical protein